MNRAIKIGLCAASGFLMQAALIGSASAEYLGYDNGDPGNWDYNAEQAGGPCNLPGQRALDPSTGQAKCCSQYNPMSACPLMRTEAPRHYYRSSRRNTLPPA